MTVTNNVAEAAESGRVKSHLHPAGSFAVEDHSPPTAQEEIWRFTPLKRMRDLPGDAAFGTRVSKYTWEVPDGANLEYVEGEHARELRGVSGFVPNTRFTARVLDEVPETLLVDIPDNAELADPVVVDLHGIDGSVSEAGHMVLRFGANSRAVVVLNHTGSASMAQVVEIVVGDGAAVTVASLQDWDDDAVHLTHTQARVGRDATYRHAAVSFGGDVVRMDCNVTYDGPGAEAELLGLYFADAGQHLEHRLFVDHNQPHTQSHVSYKGALQGEGARTVWIGNVLIRPEAIGIETYEENRNLVLTDGCQADSVPNLEIETGEIEGAGHASATGRFDDEQLFYLRSRGIPEIEARRLVVHGFFNELIRKINVPAIEDRLVKTVEDELEKNLAAEL